MKKAILKLNGLDQRVYFWGNPKKPKLFFFHGWLDTGASFDFLAPHLTDRFHCIALDFRGYGQSAHSRDPLGYFHLQYVADLHTFFHKIAGREKVSALGHSLGGHVLSLYAGAFPKRISHLINVEGFGLRRQDFSKGPERISQWIEGVGLQRFAVHQTLEDFAARLRKSNPRLPIDRSLFLARHLSRRVKSGYTMAADPKHKLMEPYLIQPEWVYAFWKKITAKCLLILADKSEMHQWLPPKDLKERLGQFPKKSKRATVKDCGHMVHHEKPEALAELIKDFL